MHPITAMGAFPWAEQQRLQKGRQPANKPANLATPHAKSMSLSGADTAEQPGKSLPGMSLQVQTGRPLAFTGQGYQPTPTEKLEAEFIHALSQSKDPTEKAALAEILGRAERMGAVPHLVKLLDDTEPSQVRATAAKALARIGSATHQNGFTATNLSKLLLEHYKKRKEQLKAQIEKDEPKFYVEKEKQQEEAQARVDEIQALLSGVSQLNVARSKADMLAEYQQLLAESRETDSQLTELLNSKEVAEEELHRQLESKYRKPIKEILKHFPADELQELQKKVIVPVEEGKEMNLLEVQKATSALQRQLEQFDLKLLSSFVKALSLQNDKQVNAALKQGLVTEDPDIRAHVLETLADRNTLNYSSDVYPSLNARSTTVRHAALDALLKSPEQAATQKTLELMSTQSYFNTAGGLNLGSLGQYVNFLTELAERGDEYVGALASRVIATDYSMESRQIGLQVLGMMSRGPVAAVVSPETVLKARYLLKQLALLPTGKTATEQNTIGAAAMKLWVQSGDPEAITEAIELADNKERRSTGKDQEALLGSVFSVLLRDSGRRSRAGAKEEAKAQLQRQVIGILEKNNPELFSSVSAQALRDSLPPDLLLRKINPDSLTHFADENNGDDADQSLVETLQSSLDELRPILTSLAESDKSTLAQMLALRLMGVLQDEKSVQYLASRVKEPLKIKPDWTAEYSYPGDMAKISANLRLNALKSLGELGSTEALEVMTAALDDPSLKALACASLDKLGEKLADSPNQHVPEAGLEKIRNQLLGVIATPDSGRAFRSIRLMAAKALYKFNGGVDVLKDFAAKATDPNFRRHALSALVSNDYALEPEHPDHALVKSLLSPGLGVEKLHARGITGQGVQMSIIDGGYVDDANTEGFQDRVRLPAQADGDPVMAHPTMVMSTAAANGKLKGIAPDAVVFSDKWPDFGSKDPMDVYKKIIEGKLRGENNIRVINNSWGLTNQNAILDKKLRKMLKEFKTVVDLAEKAGIQMVFAAGNSGEQAGLPGIGTVSLFGLDVDKLTDEQEKLANYILDKVILVGAVNTQGSEQRGEHRMAEFSSIGDRLSNKLSPTVVAPGADMMVYDWDRTKPGNAKALVNGTSFASPYVSGLIALMVQANPNLTPADIRHILKKTAVKLASVPKSQQGHGEVSPEAAVRMAESFKSGEKHRQDSPALENILVKAETKSESEVTATPPNAAAPTFAAHKKRDWDSANTDGELLQTSQKRNRFLREA